MKIFGKRKSKAVASDTPSSSNAAAGGDNKGVSAISPIAKQENEHVPSYFSSAQPSTAGSSSKKKKKQRNESSSSKQNGDDIEALLAMDPSELNSKQRRLVRRHKERDGTAADTATSVEPSKDEGGNDATGDAADAPEENHTNEAIARKSDGAETVGSTATGGEGASKDQKQNESEQESLTDPNIAEILAKLEGLNSKDRRKYLRQLKSSSGGAIDETVIAAAQEQAKKVAERNEKEAANATSVQKDKKRKSVDEKPPSAEATKTKSAEASKPKKKRRKKGPPINLDDLPPEERKRREEQRRMQKEAEERREAGLVDPNRHPLNSERRRANRRKPSKAALIAQEKREKMAERGKFNAKGYQMRKGGEF